MDLELSQTHGRRGSELELPHPTYMPLKAEFKPQTKGTPTIAPLSASPTQTPTGKALQITFPPANSWLRIQLPRRQKPYLPHLSPSALVCTCSYWYLGTALVYEAAMYMSISGTKTIVFSGFAYFCNFHMRLIFLYPSAQYSLPLLGYPLLIPLPLLG